MQSLATFFDENKPLAYAAIVAALVVVVIVAFMLYRLMSNRRLRTTANGRARQPRLGIVDAYDLDRQRQLVLVRRDNVEHLIMIGGPTDVVIETAIVRNQMAQTAREKDSAPGVSPPAPTRTEPSLGPVGPGLAERVPPRPPLPPIPLPPAPLPPDTAAPLYPSAPPDLAPPASETPLPPVRTTPAPPPPRPASLPPRPPASGPSQSGSPPGPGIGGPSGSPPPRTPLPPRPAPRSPLPPRPNAPSAPPPRPGRAPLPGRPDASPRPDSSVAPDLGSPRIPAPPTVGPAPGPVPDPTLDLPDEPDQQRSRATEPGAVPKTFGTLDSLEEEMAKLLGRPAPRRDS